MKEFANIDGFDKLFIDKVFIRDDTSEIFICKNDEHETFLCVLTEKQKNYKEWVVSKVSTDDIIDLLQSRISIKEALTISTQLPLIFTETNGQISSIVAVVEDIINLILPIGYEYLEIESEELDELVEYYTR